MTKDRTPRVVEIDVERIRENPDNVRTRLTGLEALASSIRVNGLQVPIVVHQKYKREPGKQDLELIYGHRRLAAHNINNMTKIRGEIRPFMTPDEILIMMLTELTREDPDVPGLARTVRKLRERHLLTPIQIAERVGTSEAQVWAWINGQGTVADAPLVVPGGVPTPERPRPPVLDESTASSALALNAPLAASTQRVRRGSARTPTVSASRVYYLLEDYDDMKLDGDELAKRLRGVLGGWRPGAK